MTANVLTAIRAEYERYKALAEATFDQLSDAELSVPPPGGGNSIATICWHLAGNLRSRFTNFLTEDGEKPWRKREEEFGARQVTKAELLDVWSAGWSTLLSTLDELTDADLSRTVTIRERPLTVIEALQRSLAHASYHVGQIVYAGKAIKGGAWKYLSIPPGQSDAYNAAPSFEKPHEQIGKLR